MALHFGSIKRYVPQSNGNRELSADHQISLDLKLPKVRDMLEIQEMIRSLGGSVSLAGPASDQQALQMWHIMETLIRKYTSNWNGIFLDGISIADADGVIAAVGMDAIAMISEVAQEIMLAGKGSANEAKNFALESEPGSLDSVLTATRALPLDSNRVATAAAGT